MARVLYIDAVPGAREQIADGLRRRGFDTQLVTDSRAALVALKRMTPECILLDLALPDINGMSFLATLRRSQQLVDVPIILLATAANRAHVLEVAKFKIRDYLLKTNVAQVVDRVARVYAGTSPPKPIIAGRGKSTSAAPIAAPSKGSATGAESAPPPGPQAPSSAGEQTLRRVSKALEARTFSAAVGQVIALAACPRAESKDLASLISRDMVLASRVLQVANSAAYPSRRGAIASIPDAVKQVGFANVQNVAAAVGVFDVMPASQGDGFNPLRAWQHSFAVAKLCEQFCANYVKRVNPGSAYLVGLCHDLGEILFRTSFQEEYEKVLALQRSKNCMLATAEREILGVTRTEVIRTIGECLKLPENIRKPIEAFHDGLAADGIKGDLMPYVLGIAEACANGLGLATSDDPLLSPLLRSDCEAILGTQEPVLGDTLTVRTEILVMIGLLARLSSAEERELSKTFGCGVPRKSVWLVRNPVFSPLDPIEMALTQFADVHFDKVLPIENGLKKQPDGLIIEGAHFSEADVTACGISAIRLHATAMGDAAPTLPIRASALVELTQKPAPAARKAA